MNLESNINDIKTKAQGAQLIVVTKYQTIENIKIQKLNNLFIFPHIKKK